MAKVGQIFREGLVKNIRENIKNNKNIFLVSYAAMTSTKMDSLRKNLRRINARVFVSKNRIAAIALKEVSQEKLAENMSGQTAFIWSNTDAAVISKELVQFAKGCEGFLLQGGILDGQILAKNDVKRLSDLPSREVLLSQLLATLQSPATRLASALNAKSRDLLSILKQLSEKKGGN